MIKVQCQALAGVGTQENMFIRQAGWFYPLDNSYCQNSLGRNLKNNYRRNITLVISEDMPVGKKMMDLSLNVKGERVCWPPILKTPSSITQRQPSSSHSIEQIWLWNLIINDELKNKQTNKTTPKWKRLKGKKKKKKNSWRYSSFCLLEGFNFSFILASDLEI